MVKRYGWASALLSGLLLTALHPAPSAAIDANSCGYTQGPGGWYKLADRSGPYALDGNCNATLMGTGGGSGGGSGGTGGTVTQGPPAADNTANRWPVIAYQGGTWSFGLSGPIPTGSNTIGAVTQAGAPWTISGNVVATLNQGGNALSNSNPIFAQITNLPATQPVSGTISVGNFPATQTIAGTVTQGAAGSSAWKVDGSGVTQPVSGTVSVGNLPATQAISATSLPLPAGAATSANQNSTAAGTSAVNAQGVQGVTGGVPLPVSGTVAVTQSTSPWSVSGPVSQSGTWTVAQGAAGASAWKVDGSGVTQPISASALPLPSGAATAALQSNVQSAAGTSAGTLLTIQGSSSGVPIPVSGSVSVSNQPSSLAVTNAGTFAVQNTAPVVGGNSTAIKTDGSATTQPVSGTITAAQGTAGANAWKVDGSAVTQPISVSALPLPSGAATAANQNSTAAGTSASNAQGVQGVTGGVPLLIQGGNTNAVKTDSSATTQPVSAAVLPLPAGAATSANQSNEITALQALNIRTSFGGDYAGSIAAGGTFNGQSYTASTGVTGSPARGPSSYTKFNAFFSSSAAGTAWVDGSNDGTSWQPLSSSTLTAGVGMFITTPVVFTYYRGRVVNNGTTAATGTLIQAGLAAD